MKTLNVSEFQEINPASIVQQPSKSRTITSQSIDLSAFTRLDLPHTTVIPSNIERPAHKGLETHRGFCVDMPYNKGLIDKLHTVVTKIKSECEGSLFEGDFEVINNVEDLKKLLTEVIIRFDTAPDYYTKSDYSALIGVLYQSLLYLYQVLNFKSSNEDILKIEQTSQGTELQPQTGYLYDAEEGEVPKDTAGNTLSVPENNDKRIATISDIRNYINNKLTWIEK